MIFDRTLSGAGFGGAGFGGAGFGGAASTSGSMRALVERQA
jgi:hypothetical protein